MPLYYAALEAKEPYVNRFRQMVVTFNADNVRDAEDILFNFMGTLKLLNVEIVELYKDEHARAF